jgi:anti-anti-sigma factor
MPQASVVISSTAASRYAAPSFVCTWKAGSSAAWVRAAGELDFAASPQLRQTLREAQLEARLVVLDLRELTFVGSCGVHVVLDAAHSARREAGRLLVVRGPAEVDRVLTLSGACEQVLIVDLDPTEPSPELLDVA